MKIYLLEISPSENAGDGENWDEWFSSFAKAKRRRTELIKEFGKEKLCEKFGSNLAIKRCFIASSLPKKKLILNLLNKRQYMLDEVTVMKPITTF